MINWPDRRFIGSIFLANSGVNVATNPRRWQVLGGNVDITTPEGIVVFQQAVLAFARNSVSVLTRADAQGMVQWDIEGQQIGDIYYGAPDLISQMAPEMESLVNGVPLCNAYFQIFKDAGLRIGVCIRAQQAFLGENGNWGQLQLSDDEAYLDMKNSIGYARDRWGCSLFYIDSNNAYTPTFLQLAADFSDCLLMPEHSQDVFYEFLAPFKSFIHFGTTRTNPHIQRNMPGALSMIFNADNAMTQTQKDQVMDGMRYGDIYGFNGWFWHPEIQTLINLREEAETTAPLSAPVTFPQYGLH